MARRNNTVTQNATAESTQETNLTATQPATPIKEEAPVAETADASTDVSADTDHPMIADMAVSVADAMTELAPAGTLVEVLERYIDAMDVNREIDPRAVGVPMQRQLAIAVVAAVAEPDRKQFQTNMRYLLENIREHRKGVFSDTAIFRWYDIAGIKNRREIEAILTVLLNTLAAENRQRNAKMLLGGDFTRRLNPVRAEQIARNLRGFYNVTA